MLQELHIIVPQIGRDGERVRVIQCDTSSAVKAHRPCISISIGVRVALFQIIIFVGLITFNKARSVLVQVGCIQYGTNIPVLTHIIMAHCGFLLAIVGIVLVAAVGCAVGTDTDAVFSYGITVAVLCTVVVIRPCFQC